MDIISREEAKRQGLKRYFTGKPCLRGHICERYIISSTCTQCQKNRGSKWREDNKEIVNRKRREAHELNPEKHREYQRKFQKKHPERYKIYFHKWMTSHMEEYRKRTRRYRENNVEKLKEIHRKWARKNKGKVNAYTSKRIAQRKQATMKWANMDTIEQIYIESSRLTDETGCQYSVDHIIPLQGKLVSGLHVENNLQIMLFNKNCAKGNKFNPLNPTKYEYPDRSGLLLVKNQLLSNLINTRSSNIHK